MVYTEETEKYRLKLAEVHLELEPWEKQRILHKRKYDVSFNECNILKEKVSFLLLSH